MTTTTDATLYVRISSDPAGDSVVGCSYTLGAHGDADQAHCGLSGYGADERGGLEEALDELDELLGVSGPRRWGVAYVALFSGHFRGVGPDREELFAPERLVAAIDTREIRDVAHAMELLAQYV
jgi:hypothetical protein